MVPSAEMPTQIQPTVPAPPAPPAPGLTPHEPAPRTGGPGGPPGPPKRPTGGGGGGGDGFDPGDPDDAAARRRLTLIVAGVGIVILVALFAIMSGGNDDATITTATEAPAAQTSPATVATPTPKAKAAAPASTPATTPPAATTPATTPASTPASSPSGGSGGGVAVDGANAPAASTGPLLQAGSVTKIKVNQGDTISFRVKSTTAQEVHVHGYDNKYELAAGETKVISFPATITGIFEIEFEGTSTQIGELTVEP